MLFLSPYILWTGPCLPYILIALALYQALYLDVTWLVYLISDIYLDFDWSGGGGGEFSQNVKMFIILKWQWKYHSLSKNSNLV